MLRLSSGRTFREQDVPLASCCPQASTALSSWGHLDFPQILLGLFLGSHSPNNSNDQSGERGATDTTEQLQGVHLKLSAVKDQLWINAFVKCYQNESLEKRPCLGPGGKLR